MLHSFGTAKLFPKPTLFASDIIGGLLLGAGIALAGACPGTLLAQVGAGYRDAIFTLLGGVAGVIAFSYSEPILKPSLMSGGPGKITFADLTGIPYLLLALGLAALIIMALIGLENWRPWRQEMGRDVGDFGDASPGRTSDLPARHHQVAE